MTGIGGNLAKYGATGPGISVGGNLETAEKFSQMSASAAKADMTLEQYIANEQKKIAADKGELDRQSKIRLEQMGAAQALDTTVKKFTLLNSVTDTVTSAFSKLTTVLPGTPAGGRPEGGLSGAPGGGALPAGGAGGGVSGASLSGLDQNFASKFKAAAGEYKAITGKDIQVTSGLRDSAKQAELYKAYIEGRSKFPAAPPGTSQHELGRAVDVDLASANALEKLGLLQKYGLSRPVANDPIHIQGASGYRGMLSGPMSGYSPRIRMHGDEELSITPRGRSLGGAAGNGDTNLDLVSVVRELVTIGKNQLYTTQKMLKYQQ
jgi:hypothetical protein